MGKFLQDSGVNDIYVMAPNYQAGKDMVAGLKRYYKGRIVEEVYTKLGQQDYQAEITQLRAKNPKAVLHSIRAAWASSSCVNTSRPACTASYRSTPSTRSTRSRSRR